MLEHLQMEAPYELKVTIDRNSNIPLYQQISGPLEQAIISGEVEPGRLIEDEISMAKRLEVSRPTTRRAFQKLVNRGLLTRRRGVGTRVTPAQVHRPMELTSLAEDLKKSGSNPSTKVISYQVMEADEKQANDLGVEVGAGVLVVTRLRLVDDEPLALLTNQMRLEAAPSWSQLQEQGLYENFDQKGIRPVTAHQVIGARTASAEEAQLLEEPEGSAVLTMYRVAYDEDGGVVEIGHHVYRPSKHSFSFTVFAS
ncbi:MAG: GntR family transcriptional regulator [Actinomycetaceae bacterium]|nr:GntR family transcriptional regulator [Actinomycetaceae bacterium]